MLYITRLEVTFLLDTIKEARNDPGLEEEFDEAVELLEALLDQDDVDIENMVTD